MKFKRSIILLILYTSANDPSSALFCDIDTLVYVPESITATANVCITDKVFKDNFDGH